MKYIVTRTSNWNDDPKMKGVQKEILPYSYPPGMRIREELKETYTIELDSLDELHQFIKDCGCPIVVSSPYKDGSGFQLPEIEIYDDYRE
jgi:hypothetical protein